MNIQDVKKKKQPKRVRLNLKTTEEISKWMKKENISPQLIFDKTIEELRAK